MIMNQTSPDTHQPSVHAKTLTPKIVLAVLVLIAAAGIGFYGGVAYQRQHQTVASNRLNAPSTGQAGFGRGRFASNRVVGQVTAISPTSISIQNSRTGSSVTLAISSSTTITSNGQTATTGDIQVGSTVFATENSSNTSQAMSILVNPSFGGGSAPGSGAAPSATVN